VAVPSGTYDARVELDLGPLGRFERDLSLAITAPPADVLARRLRQLESEDPAERLAAVCDLAWFERDADRVVPAIVRCLSDPDRDIRQGALGAFFAFPEAAYRHRDRILALVRGGPDVHLDTRQTAAILAANLTPYAQDVEAALKALAADRDEELRRVGECALATYRSLHEGRQDGEHDR